MIDRRLVQGGYTLESDMSVVAFWSCCVFPGVWMVGAEVKGYVVVVRVGVLDGEDGGVERHGGQ